MEIVFNMKLPCKLQKRKNWVLASCPVLDVTTQGETENKAKKNLSQALSLFLISCFERGTLDDVLKDCGFKSVQQGNRLKQMKPGNFINVPVPLSWTKTHVLHNQCHA